MLGSLLYAGATETRKYVLHPQQGSVQLGEPQVRLNITHN